MYHLSSNKKTHQSAELIYHALCDLISEKEFTSISITELTEKAGVGRATFYRLFDSIKDVLQYQCDAAFQELSQSVLDYRRSERLTEPTNSTNLLKPLLRFWYLDSLIIEVMIQANSLDILLGNIERLFERVYKKLNDQANPFPHKDYFVSIRTGILFTVLVKWVKNKKNIPPDELADLVLHQVQASENLKLFF